MNPIKKFMKKVSPLMCMTLLYFISLIVAAVVSLFYLLIEEYGQIGIFYGILLILICIIICAITIIGIKFMRRVDRWK